MTTDNPLPINPRNRILGPADQFVTVACGPWAPMPTRPRSHKPGDAQPHNAYAQTQSASQTDGGSDGPVARRGT